MLLGPVFHFEAITTSRRARYYVARGVYGVFLLFALWKEYLGWGRYGRLQQATVRDMAKFAESTFLAFAAAQAIALVCLIPALVAGVIADEHRRKTLRDLLASGLSSTEIVLGKLGARLLHVGVFLALGMPIVCLVGLFGGLDPWNVLYVYGGTASSALLVAGLSMLVSVVAPRPREAILSAYGLVAVWLLVPPYIEPIVPYLDWPLNWVRPVNDVVLMGHPYQMWQLMLDPGYLYRGNPAMAWWAMARLNAILHGIMVMVAIQAALGLLFLIAAILALRPLRGGAGRRPRKPSPARLRPEAARPEIGDDPMLWKERYTRSGGGLSWLSSGPVILVLGTLLGCYLFDTAWPALAELGRQRYGPQQEVLNGALRESSTLVFVLWMLGVASAGAVAITGEREQDTWACLTTTLLTGREIVRAKLLGALWGPRRLGLALIVMWTVGVLAGGIHPLGGLASLLALAAFSWFAAALGLFLSLRARNSVRALLATIVALLVLNAGALSGYAPQRGDESWSLAGASPLVLWATLVSERDVHVLTSGTPDVTSFWGRHGWNAFRICLASVTFYALSAFVLSWAAVRSFDRAIDRPRVSS